MDNPDWLETIFSEISGEPLHYKVSRPVSSGAVSSRTDVTDAEEFLQVGVMEFPGDATFASHIHKQRPEASEIFLAQEAWVVIDGEVEVSYFDSDATFLCTRVLRAGDISITLRGGHGYSARGRDCLVYEFKTGPYRGTEIDKTLIEGP